LAKVELSKVFAIVPEQGISYDRIIKRLAEIKHASPQVSDIIRNKGYTFR